MVAVKHDKMLEGLPIVWAEFHAHRTTRDLFRTLEVITLPTIHFYDGSRGLVENFPCPPTKIPLLKKKLARFLNSRVDGKTLQLKEVVETESRSEPRVQRNLIDNELITSEHIDYLRNGLPFFRDLTDEEFDGLLEKARLLTFDPGDVIIKQGMPGDTFYVLKRGVVEMNIKSRFDDPIKTPPNYLGVVVNTLNKFDYFGERALTTGEPLAASVRVLEKVRCFAFNVEDIPESSILSKKRRATRDIIDQLSQRYKLPEDYTPNYPVTPRDDCILDLLVRFKQIRQAAKCFDYIMEAEPNWGDEGEIARRTMLTRKLSQSQRDEFKEVFCMVDAKQSGQISLLEMRKFMQSARKAKKDEDLVEMIDRAHPVDIRGNKTDRGGISLDEFMGVMAEAEFYTLFKETFQELDQRNIGYVRAGDLDEVLGGVRDLISDERQTSIIDVDDKDMLVDYEQFTKMLLGAAL
jgi:Ca2+-binding EF-hand superfamily protein